MGRKCTAEHDVLRSDGCRIRAHRHRCRSTDGEQEARHLPSGTLLGTKATHGCDTCEYDFVRSHVALGYECQCVYMCYICMCMSVRV